ncbi:VPLPA-CTERM sorting domain-containing protein [Telluria aromaticivorans]|uniref:VPLPA-CTERM sorting domain-containing protein n=1 Tax=Telluria aromaticivorans TaxID=2725995 RepID=A0A7Y2JVG2_9BURK|nr:VPLPA-CTERM sorting domain-containing protein [Telluria aromaticivorans]NNG21413.1 VPLPA-CTERM sorting domain-containing protein [Telluria aromaticivorans]
MQKRAAAAVMLGLAGCTLGIALTWSPDPVAAALPGSPALLALASPAVLERMAGQAPRRIYPYSIVPGGVAGQAELKRIIRTDKVVAEHYATFNVDKAHPVTVSKPRAVHVSYRKGDKVYWTAKKVMLAEGETLLSDGSNEMRARCANRISDVAQFPVEAQEPSAEVLDSVVDEEAYGLAGDKDDAAFELVNGAIPRHTGRGMQAPLSSYGGGGRIAEASAMPSSVASRAGMENTALSQFGSSSSLESIPRSGATAPVKPGSPPPTLEVSPETPKDTKPADVTGALPGVTPLPVATDPSTGTTDGGKGNTLPVPATPPVTANQPPAGGGTEGRPLAPLPGEAGPKPGPFIPEPTLLPPAPPAGTGEEKPDTAEVPEPASVWLIGAALAGMALLRRRRR